MGKAAFIAVEWVEPLAVLAGFAREPWVLALISDGLGERGRWSYLARDPDAVLEIAANDPRDPFQSLTEMIGPVELDHEAGPSFQAPPFQGGVAGLATYDLASRTEPVAVGETRWPLIACGRYGAVLAFDHRDHRVVAVGRGESEDEAHARAAKALTWMKGAKATSFQGPLVDDLSGDEGEAYEAAVADVVRRIEAGEIFQANIARRWQGRLRSGADPFDLLARLAAQSPAPFAAYLRLTDRALVSNSPERFVQVRPEDGRFRVETRPIKGTAPRGRTPAEDAAYVAALLASEKDRAENLMIVDLMRNDLARVCLPGKVKAPELFRAETFVNVHHLVSTVTGELAPGLTAVDLMRAAFPPGSVTGAPKTQALKVIAGLEPPRGPYCGSMFWAGLDGGFDSSVLIRTAAFEQEGEGWTVEARAGAGIVADSVPRAERLETEAKIAALRGALLGDG
jgi:para-aminobenzoate synthetase component 1